MTIGMITDDEYGLDIGIPYYAIKLTAEEAKRIKNCKVIVYHIDGREMIEFHENGKDTGQRMIFLYFIPDK